MPRKRATPAISDIIAERVFQRADGKEVRALVGRPRKGKRDWMRIPGPWRRPQQSLQATWRRQPRGFADGDRDDGHPA